MKIVVALVAFVLGLGVGIWWSRTGETEAPARKTVGGADAAQDAEIVRLERETGRRQAEVSALLERVAELTLALESRGAVEADGDGAAPKTHVKEPRFVYAETEAGLRAIDWGASGASMVRLNRLLAELADLIRKGEEIPDEMWADITVSAAPLIRQAVVLEQRGVPGTGASGAWGHPSALANLIHATLKEASRPLSEEQEKELDRVASSYLDEDRRRRVGYAEATLKMRRMLDEAMLKDRFIGAVESSLTKEQREVVRPPEIRGFVGLDSFGGNVLWDERIDHLTHRSAEDLADECVEDLLDGLSIKGDPPAVLVALAAEWARSFPRAYVLEKPDRMRRAGIEREERVLTAVRAQIALHEALLAQAALTEQQRKILREDEDVMVPYRKE